MGIRSRVVIPKIDLTGYTIGYWYIIGPAPPQIDSHGRPSIGMYHCRCRCGTERDVRDVELRRLGSLSCGCYNREVSSTHQKTHTRLHEIWHGMKQRCNNPNSKDAKNYSNRGIDICDEWSNDFMAFWNWAMENGYSDELSLDRIDVDRGYSPDNCRWATPKEQARNTRFNHLLTLNGETKTMVEWAEITGIEYFTLANRIYNGWSDERALTEPVHTNKRSRFKERENYGNSTSES